jgi:hypothetical protein
MKQTSSHLPMKLMLLVAVAGLLSAAGLGQVRQTLGLWNLGQAASPYFIPAEALGLYVLTPLYTLAFSIFSLAPGFLISAAFGRDKTLAQWIIAGFGAALLVVCLPASAIEMATGLPLRGHGFLIYLTGLNVAAVVLLSVRLAMGERPRLDLAGQGPDAFVAILLFLVTLILMSPKFYWENFSGDGSGSLQFARNYIHTHWPFWAPEAGTIAKAPGLTSFLFVLPDSWFVRFWGEWEYSVRAPLLVGLALLYPLVTALIRHGRPGAELRAGDHLLIAAALLLYAFANIYSGGYHAWFGDSPMPVARETLAMVCFMGYVLMFLQRRWGLMFAAGLMAHLSIPTGGLWLLMWPVAVWLTSRPRSNDALVRAGLLLVVAAVISIFGPALVRAAGLPFPGGEFNAESISRRLRYVAVMDWQRFAFLAIPVGIVPVVSLLGWRRHDSVSRALTLLTIAYFGFFYLQGYRVLLHHFIPAMIPPLVVLWRSPLMERSWSRPAVLAGLILSTVLAWPREMKMHDHDRAFAAFIATEGPRFASSEPLDGERFRGFDPKALDTFHDLFGKLLPIGYVHEEAGERFFGAPLAWWYYSEYPKAEGQVINYVIKPVADARPEDGQLFEAYDGYGLYIRDMALFDLHRTQKLPIDTGSSWLATHRSIMFGSGKKVPQKWNERLVIDLVPMIKYVLGME